MRNQLFSILAGMAGAVVVLVGFMAVESKAEPESADCRQWEARMVRIASDGEELPAGWEPYGFMWTNMGKDYVGARRCVSR